MSDTLHGSVLVIGGGIAGIQSALDLTGLGFKVYLVEKKPTIGGTMAQLDKTFPTLDCSLCILAPKMVEVFRNPNIELLTYSHVKNIKGSGGNYTVKIVKKPRYVKEDLCKGCGDCAKICPVKEISSEFDANLKTHGAAYISFPSSVPPVYLIDENYCLKLNLGICGLCEQACSASAIDFSQKPEIKTIQVGAIIIATGYEQHMPDYYTRLAGSNPNVVSSMQFERLLSANGPTGGQLLRLDDKKHPHKIAFLQCVGSRDFHHPEFKKYCSAICCMSSAKQAIVAKEHSPDLECSIFNTEIRAKGKNFYEFIVNSQEEYGVNYVNGRVAFVKENEDNGKLILHYENMDKGIVETSEFDMVVLASALFPNQGYYKLLDCLEVGHDDLGYINEEGVNNCEEGYIYFTGYSRRPKDIPNAVAEGSACAARISEKLYPVRFENIKDIVYPKEKPILDNEEPRVGVLVCQCGINIGGVVDTSAVVDYVSSLPYVARCEENMYSCSSDSQERIKEMIKEYNLNRFIVASCTPRTHEPLFQNTLREAGLNPFLFELVNIRDQDSWVHQKEPDKATEKACDLIRMYLAKVVNLNPQKKIKVPVQKASLVIGGGITGIIAAHNLARQGFEVFLVERGPNLGGRALEFVDLYYVAITKQEILKEINELKNRPNVHLLLNSKIRDIRGFVGNYMINTEGSTGELQEFKVGTIIVATGSRQIESTRWKDLKEKYPDRIMTQTEFISTNDVDIPGFQDATIILCVDQRKNKLNQGEGVKTYCSNICCGVALKNIEKLLAVNPDANVHVLYRELQFSDLYAETLWRKLRKMVSFERYRSIDDILIIDDKGRFHLKYDLFGAGVQVENHSDLIILATPNVPESGTKDLAKMLKVPTTKDGFFLEAHVKLRPIDFATEGIFLCGGAHWPKWIDESITQAYGAAARASMIMVKGEVETEGITSSVDEEKCVGCGRCREVCPYSAIDIIETEAQEFGIYTVTVKKARIISAMCKGCGTCVAECPTGAIDQRHYSKYQIIKQIDLLTGLNLQSCEKEQS